MHNNRPSDVLDLYDTDETLPSPAALRHASVKVKRTAEAAGMDMPAEPVFNGTSGGVAITVSRENEEKENMRPMPVEKKRKEEVSSKD